MSERAESNAGLHRGPIGIPFVEMDESRVVGWESGGFLLAIEREDHERLRANFTEDQLRALKDAIEHTLEGGDE